MRILPLPKITLLALAASILCMPLYDGQCDPSPKEKTHHKEKKHDDDDTVLTFGVPVKKFKSSKHHKETIEDRCWDDDNCKFPTLFCLFFDPDNKKGKCQLPNS